MYRKKFIPPLLNKDRYNNPTIQKSQALEEGETARIISQPHKRLKTNHQFDRTTESSHEGIQVDGQEQVKILATFTPGVVPRRPLLSVKTPAPKPLPSNSQFIPAESRGTAAENGSSRATEEAYYNVLYRKPSVKKHKTFDGDGILIVSLSGHATLKGMGGRDLGKCYLGKKTLGDGDLISVGGREVQVQGMLEKEEFLQGTVFSKGMIVSPPKVELSRTKIKLEKKRSETNLSTESNRAMSNGEVDILRGLSVGPMKQFKVPLLSTTVIPKDKTSKMPIPRHDPNAENALTMPRPNPSSIPSGKRVVDVVVDPFIGQHLRPHQREGVKFLYEAVMGMKSPGCHGAILADDMGLGKTLQTIALLWTLLKQNPIYEAQPVIKKALVVCPVTLIKNWKKEFRKWLGPERIGVFAVGDDERKKVNVNDFTAGKVWSVMIVGYERLQKIHAELKKGEIDIVIADEGHRLKAEKNKAAQAIRALSAKRRVILSGTPLQNDLHEFFIMVDFVNPSLLDTYNVFRRTFENPIVKSRQPGATKKDIEMGEARGNKLTSITNTFILRRTAEILSKYLPPKLEYVVFCSPSSIQLNLYKQILESPAFMTCIDNPQASLQLITILKKLCNSPALLPSQDGENDKITSILPRIKLSALKSLTPAASGKLRVLDRMLITLRQRTDEKIVIVSNYTSTLDMLQKLLLARGYTFLRLDGSTPSSKRQDLVDQFNRVDARNAFAFLLSAKSGGVGLNLVGASRLVLYDCDWNPATDQQAMARIHRDGQKREVKIYRMITTGCIDEKIYQRQLTKQGLADSVMDQKFAAAAFTQAELRDIFTFDDTTECQTHGLLGCICEGRGILTGSETPNARTPNARTPEGGYIGPSVEGNSENNAEIDSDNDDTLSNFPGLMSASMVDMERIQLDFKKSQMRVRGGKTRSKSKKEEFGSLYRYKHFCTSRISPMPEPFDPLALGVERRRTSSKYFDGRSEEDDEDERGERGEVEVGQEPAEEEEEQEVFIEDDVLRRVIRETNEALAREGRESERKGNARGWISFVFEKLDC